MCRKLRISAVLVFVLSSLALPASTFAQENTGSLAEVWLMTVKQGQQADFEAAFKAHGAVRVANGDVRKWEIYVPVTGDDLNTYVIRACCFAWADQDGYTTWTESTPAVMGDWFTNVDAFVESYAHYFSELDRDHSNWPEDTSAIRFIGLTHYYLTLQQAPAFTSARKELSQIALNQGWSDAGHHWGWADRIGGEPEVTLAIPFNSYADMASEGETFIEFAVRTMGEENAKDLLQRFAAGVKSSDYTIYQRRADLSPPGDG